MAAAASAGRAVHTAMTGWRCDRLIFVHRNTSIEPATSNQFNSIHENQGDTTP